MALTIRHPAGVAAGFAEEPPGFDPGDGSLNWPPETRVCPVHALLFDCEVFARSSPVGNGDGGAGALVAAVGQDRNAQSDAGGDDPLPAGRGEIMGPAGQRR
jgi:hypothetical protein